MTEAADKGVSRQENGCMFLHGKESHTLTYISRLLPGIGSICALTQAAHHQPWLSVAEESQVSVCVCVCVCEVAWLPVQSHAYILLMPSFRQD